MLSSERTRGWRKITDGGGACVEREEGGTDEDEGEEESGEEDDGYGQAVRDPPSRRCFHKLHDWDRSPPLSERRTVLHEHSPSVVSLPEEEAEGAVIDHPPSGCSLRHFVEHLEIYVG